MVLQFERMESKATYQSTYVTCLLEIIEERCLQFPVAMVVGFVRLQNLVESFM
jgi:hypothetical protein